MDPNETLFYFGYNEIKYYCAFRFNTTANLLEIKTFKHVNKS